MESLHEYKVTIGKTTNPGYHPLSVVVSRHGDELFEKYGKNLNSLLRDAIDAIKESERQEQ